MLCNLLSFRDGSFFIVTGNWRLKEVCKNGKKVERNGEIFLVEKHHPSICPVHLPNRVFLPAQLPNSFVHQDHTEIEQDNYVYQLEDGPHGQANCPQILCPLMTLDFAVISNIVRISRIKNGPESNLQWSVSICYIFEDFNIKYLLKIVRFLKQCMFNYTVSHKKI